MSDRAKFYFHRMGGDRVTRQIAKALAVGIEVNGSWFELLERRGEVMLYADSALAVEPRASNTFVLRSVTEGHDRRVLDEAGDAVQESEAALDALERLGRIAADIECDGGSVRLVRDRRAVAAEIRQLRRVIEKVVP